jgi:hypothetical protein
MGHYYADMACSRCGFVRCQCPPKPPEPAKWFINKDFVAEKTRPMVYFSGVRIFNTKDECEAAIPDYIREKINELEAEIDVLRVMLGEDGETQ